MFEQFSTAEKHTNPWAVMLSFTGQAAIAGTIVLLSIIQFQQLDLSALALQPPPLFAPSPLREAVRIVAVERSGVTPRVTLAPAWRPLTVPARIPDKVHIIDDGPQVPIVSMGELLSHPAGRGTGVSEGLLYGREQGTVVPPPPPPENRVAVKPVERAPIRIGGNVLEAMVIRKITPVYPPLARQMRLTGVVRLMGVIGSDGTVQNLQVFEGHPLFVRAAVDAVRQWLYRPTLLNGEPVPVTAPIEVRFVLR